MATTIKELSDAVVTACAVEAEAEREWNAARAAVRVLADENCGIGTDAEIRAALRTVRIRASVLDKAQAARAFAVQTLQAACSEAA